MKRRDKIFIAVVALIIISLVVLVSRKPEELNDSDLYIKRIPIPEDQNAYTYIKQAEACMVKSSNYRIYDYGEGTNIVDEQEVVKHIKDNQETVNIMSKAVTYKDCQLPVIDMKKGIPVSGVRNIARILRLKSEHERRSGNYVQSTDLCITLLRFGRLITKDPEAMIQYLMGIACLGLGQSQAERIISSPDIQENELRKLLKENKEIDYIRNSLTIMAKREYVLMCKSIDDIRKDPVDEIKVYEEYSDEKDRFLIKMWCVNLGYFLDANKTKILFANMNRQFIRNASRSYTNAELDIYQIPTDRLRDKIGSIIGPNAFGKHMYGVSVPSVSGIYNKKCVAECYSEALTIMAACRLYEMKNGKMPEKLDALVPEYLESVPLDPYDGKPFRYKPEKDIIYSVGRDCVDNGGSTNSPKSSYYSATRWYAEDAVFEIHKK